MSARHELVALMPMRHDSERVPGKNYRPFGDGRPLYQHALEALAGCPRIDAIAIDTDSPTIKEQCARAFPDVIVIDRPEHLRDGMIPMNDVLVHDASVVEADFYLQTHSTNPLLTSDTLGAAIDAFFANQPANDSLFGVTRVQSRFWNAEAVPVNHDPGVLARTQDLPPLFEENSCLYLFAREVMESRRNRIGERPLLWELAPREAFDIDVESEFELAELLVQAAAATAAT